MLYFKDLSYSPLVFNYQSVQKKQLEDNQHLNEKSEEKLSFKKSGDQIQYPGAPPQSPKGRENRERAKISQFLISLPISAPSDWPLKTITPPPLLPLATISRSPSPVLRSNGICPSARPFLPARSLQPRCLGPWRTLDAPESPRVGCNCGLVALKAAGRAWTLNTCRPLGVSFSVCQEVSHCPDLSHTCELSAT